MARLPPARGGIALWPTVRGARAADCRRRIPRARCRLPLCAPCGARLPPQSKAERRAAASIRIRRARRTMGHMGRTRGLARTPTRANDAVQTLLCGGARAELRRAA